eukprot:3020463-Prymnesium_polylepis.1
MSASRLAISSSASVHTGDSNAGQSDCTRAKDRGLNPSGDTQHGSTHRPDQYHCDGESFRGPVFLGVAIDGCGLVQVAPCIGRRILDAFAVKCLK